MSCTNRGDRIQYHRVFAGSQVFTGTVLYVEDGWAQVRTDTGERGWVEVQALCSDALVRRP